jgi:hypothetical protein
MGAYWEGSFKYDSVEIWVHADYRWEYDVDGNESVVITDMSAFLMNGNPVSTTENMIETVASIIQNEEQDF